MKFRHADLFTGIGGFTIAAQEVWGDDYENVAFCETDDYCRALIKLRFGGDIYGDIKKLKLARGSADFISAGVPCQPASQAGKRRGAKDDRWLWGETYRVIEEVRPRWVLLENVAGLTSLVQYEGTVELEGKRYNTEKDARADLDKVYRRTGEGVFHILLERLKGIGYIFGAPFIIPACAVNAPHRRDRVWIIAHSGCEYGEGKEEQRKYENEDRQEAAFKPQRSIKCDRARADSLSSNKRCDNGSNNRQERYIHSNKRTAKKDKSERRGRECGISKVNKIITDTESAGQQSSIDRPREEQFWGSSPGENWLEVATRLCGVDDGFPAGLDGFKLSKSGRRLSYKKVGNKYYRWSKAAHRVERLKALGNAIVPQVAIEIFKAIKEADEKWESQ